MLRYAVSEDGALHAAGYSRFSKTGLAELWSPLTQTGTPSPRSGHAAVTQRSGPGAR